MIERRGDGFWPYLMDFGLARELDAQSSTTTGLIEGTPAYMSPEQALGSVRRLDHRADIYSLGATLYLLLTGRMPFPGSSVDVIFEILTSDPPRPRKIDPSLHVDLETLVMKCMEKQPERRYASAKLVADDLQRYLVGGRITARPPGLLQRLGKFMRRHKLLVASGGAALVASIVLGGVALRTRWQAAAQARLAQELGQDIKEIELFMRAAYGLPLHDISREQQVVRTRMAELTNKLAVADSRSAGALRYALGRGHLVLREYPEAQAALEQAEKLGYETPEARLALGLTLGERYRQELEQAQRAGDKKWIEARERELEAQYLKPALSYLSGAKSSVEAPSYLQGLLHFYRRQYAESLSAAQRAQSEAPWLSEPLRLEGDVYQVMGIQMLDRGQHRDARALLVRAAARHEAASAISSSDSMLYAKEAIDWIRIMEVDANIGASIDEAQKVALSTSESAIVASPRSASGYQLKSWAYWRASFVKMTRGQDGEPETRQSIELAQKSIQLNPSEWQSHYYYALGLGMLVGLASQRGTDAAELNQRAISELKETIKLNQNFAWAWNDLGIQFYFIWEEKLLRGALDKRLSAEIEKCYERATQIDPTYVNPYYGRMAVRLASIEYSVAHGQDIDAELASLIDIAKKAESLHDSNVESLRMIGLAKLQKIDQLQRKALVPESLFAEVMALFEQSRALNPTNIFMSDDLTRYHVLHARNEVLLGRSPQPDLDKAMQNMAKLEKPSESLYSFLLTKARVYVAAAQAQGVSARADGFFAQALAAAQQAVVMSPKTADTHDSLCEVLRETVQARAARPLPAQQTETQGFIERGMAECTKTLDIDATRATTHANLGSLFLLRASRRADADAKRRDAGHAVRSLTTALEINPWLRRDYGPLLTAAKALTSASESALPGRN